MCGVRRAGCGVRGEGLDQVHLDLQLRDAEQLEQRTRRAQPELPLLPRARRGVGGRTEGAALGEHLSRLGLGGQVRARIRV